MMITSKDGTKISYEKSGEGPALILVDGAFCHRKLGPLGGLAPLISNNATVYYYDRRGRNESGDSVNYSVQRELEDLKAIIDVAGGKATVFGMSSGAALAIRAAEAGMPIIKLILYEPPFHVDLSNHEEHLRKLKHLISLIETDQRDKAVWYFQAEIVGIPKFVIGILRITPLWKRLKEVAPTLRYDMEILEGGALPTERLRKISVPTLVIGGDKSPKFLKDAAAETARTIPGAELVLLKNQNHNFSPKRLAPVLIENLNR